MSDRERWILYPLLFCALVMAFKAEYRDRHNFSCRTIECQQLKVQMINGSAVLASPSILGPQLRALRYYFSDGDPDSSEPSNDDSTAPLAEPPAVDHRASAAETPSESPSETRAAVSPEDEAAAGESSPDESQ